MGAEQFGLFNRAQARAAGLSEACICKRLRAGKLDLFLPNVYGIPGTPASWHQDQVGACLWAGEGSAASHRAAARIWEVDGFSDARVEISTITNKRPNGLNIAVHRVDRFLLPEIVTVSGIPTTSMRRTLLDLAGTKHPRTEVSLDHAIRRKLTSLGELWLLYEEDWTRGRRGIAILRTLLIDRTPGEAPTQSDLELLFRRIVRRANLPQPQQQYLVNLPSGPFHIDFAYPEARLAIELDGYAYHSDREQFDEDRARSNELQLFLGWYVLRFTWAMLKWSQWKVVGLIRHHLDLLT